MLASIWKRLSKFSGPHQCYQLMTMRRRALRMARVTLTVLTTLGMMEVEMSLKQAAHTVVVRGNRSYE